MSLPVVTIAQMRDWEQASWDAGRSEQAVIERVGRRVARRVAQLTRRGDRVLVLAGKGHNGDDARGAAPHLDRRTVQIVEVGDPDAATAEVSQALALRPDLVIDGLFGIGLNRPLSPSWIQLIDTINEARLPVLAVDVPSGLQADTGEVMGAVVRAALTLTLAAPKTGLLVFEAAEYVGRLEVEPDIGLVTCPVTSDVVWTLADDFRGFPPIRPDHGHKGSFGHVILLGGSPGYHGAAVLAARGAQRAGPGLISLLTHEATWQPCAAQLQSVMVHAWSEALRGPENSTAFVIGPGLASPTLPDYFLAEAVRLWRECASPVVVDASALDWVPRGDTPEGAVRVLTPHPGEASRLLDRSPAEVQADRVGTLRELSARYGNAWIALKGRHTLVGRARGVVAVNSSGNPRLAQGGSGDLLAGYLGGLLAQPALQSDAFLALRYAVWQHGAAADRLQRHSSAWTIEDLATRLGSVTSGPNPTR